MSEYFLYAIPVAALLLFFLGAYAGRDVERHRVLDLIDEANVGIPSPTLSALRRRVYRG